MPVEAPQAPTDPQQANADTEAVSTDAPQGQPAQQDNPQESEDRKVFDEIQRNLQRKPDGDRHTDEPGEETTPAHDGSPPEKQDAEAQQDQPAITLNDKAKQFAKDLGIEDDDGAFDAALRAYQRDAIFDDDELTERFRKNPERFIETGLKRAKAQKDQDAYTFRFSEVNRELEQIKAGKPPESQKDDAPDIGAEVKADITEVLNALGDDDQYGDLKEPLGIMATTLAEKLHSRHQQSLQTIQQQHEQERQDWTKRMESMGYAMVDMRIDATRQRLADQYPSLADAKTHDRVLKRYDRNVSSPDFENVEKAYEDAVRAELGEESVTELRKRLMTNSQQRRNGQPHRPTQNTQPKPPTPDEQDRRVYEDVVRERFGKDAQRYL